MDRINRSRAETLGELPWLAFLITFLIWTGWSFIKTGKGKHVTDPLEFVFVLFLAGYVVSHIIWLFKKSFRFNKERRPRYLPCAFPKRNNKD